MTTRRKTTRNAANSHAPDRKDKIAELQQKVFISKEDILGSDELQIHRLYHPGKEAESFFVLEPERQQISQVVEFNQPHRSWLINENVCSNGRIYLTTPMDVTFILLHALWKHGSKRPIQLETIEGEAAAFNIIIDNYATEDILKNISDVTKSLDLKLYKYNPKKALAWLSVKCRRLAARLKKEELYCGFSSASGNYVKSEKTQESDDVDYLKTACGIVGSYVDAQLCSDLFAYFSIAEGDAPETKPKAADSKRKSSLAITSPDVGSEENDAKRIKLENEVKTTEKKVNNKEKKLAKAAAGSKNIASFFKK